MPTTDSTPLSASARHSSTPPAQRLLETATKLFSAQGIRAIGIDQILRESGVAKASLYSAYGSKHELVIAYLDSLDQGDRNRWSQATGALTSPRDKLLTFFDLAIAGAPTRNFRGCQYANAATEFPDQTLAPIADHRRWVLETMTGLLTEAGADDPAADARQIQVIYDGALSGSKMDRSVEPIRVGRAMAVAIADR